MSKDEAYKAFDAIKTRAEQGGTFDKAAWDIMKKIKEIAEKKEVGYVEVVQGLDFTIITPEEKFFSFLTSDYSALITCGQVVSALSDGLLKLSLQAGTPGMKFVVEVNN